MSFYGFLADVVVFAHLAYMGYVVFGQLIIMIGWPLGWQWIRNPWFRFSHLAMILVVVIEAMYQVKCPLTRWEGQLRRAAGQVVDDDMSFGGRLVHEIQFAGDTYWPDYIDTSYYIAGAIIVLTAILVPPRLRRRPAPVPGTAAATEPATAMTASTTVAPPAGLG
ncbi:MAG: DUF2784 domain-containing protein [Planctomycetes bacterium]|nr:DUF2784 domain-containing protein [Planctomycetota bacterium]